MLHQRLLAILSTAVLAMTAVPMIPAAAADETPPASQSAEEEAIRRIFEPGFDWERYGAINLTVSAPTLTAADSFSGIRGTLSEPDTAFYIVTDWVGTRPAPDTEPLGTVQIERCQYDIYRCEAGKSSIHPNNTCTEYWSVPVEKPETAQSTIHLSDHFAAWTKLGLPTGRFDYFNSFVSEKLEKGGWSVVEPEDGGFTPYFETAKPEQQPVRIKDGELESGFFWELYQTKEEGSAWTAPNAANGFTAAWADIPSGGRTLFDICKQTDISDFTAQTAGIGGYKYTAKADITGNASLGIIALLTDDSPTDEKQTEVHIVDAWSGTRPEFETKCGVYNENEAAYDIYKTTVSTTIGGSSIKTVERTQFWIVNQVNQMPEKADTEFTAAHDIIAFLNKLTQYGMDTVAIRVIGICAEVQDGAGTVTFTENAPRFSGIGTAADGDKQTTDDGYFWFWYTFDVAHETKLEYKEDGKFTAFWDQAESDTFECGITDTEFILHDEQPIRYHYSAEVNFTGGAAVGVHCTLTNPHVEVFITDGISGNLPDNYEKIGTETIGDNTYDIYHTEPANANYTFYWFMNQKNQLAESGVGTVSGDHNITAVLRTLEGYGQFIGEVESVAAMLRANYDGSGSASFTENFCGEQKNTEPEQQTAVKDIFGRLLTVGKQITINDIPPADQPDQKSYLLENYEIASMEDLIMPSMYLKGDWKPGEPLEVDFTLFHNYLKFCEENQIPVVIGPFVAPRSLPTLEYYKDETGKDLTPEKMNERFDEIIKLTFNALKESYPDLKISGAIVSSQILADPLIGNSRNSIQLVYGKDNFDFLPEIYASARKYAPNITALYMEEDFSTELGFIDDFAAVADNIRKENDCIDGTALTVSVYEPDSWTEAVSKSFCTAVKKLDKLDMKLILSDVYVTCRTPYNDTVRSAGYQILFRDILSVHDKIDAVLLSDCTQYLDGAHPLANTRGFTEALSSAASKYGKQEPSATKNGDVNCDDAIDVSDAVLLARYVTEDRSAQINDQGRANADADGNGKVEADDVIHILRIIAKLI